MASRKIILRIARGFALLLFVCLGSTGCGKGKGEVTGTVTFNDKPLTFGTVSVMDDDGLAQQATIEKDGSYRFERVTAGEARFVVTCVDPKEAEKIRKTLGRSRDSVRSKGRPSEKAEKDPVESKGSLIPSRYGDFTQSDLKHTVEPGTTNKIDLKLTGPAEDGD